MIPQIFLAARVIVGALLLLAGVVALLTPLTPGSWLAVIGLQMLGWHINLGRTRTWLHRVWKRL